MARLDAIDAIRARLRTDPPWSVYALGDLAPEHFGHSAWHADGCALWMLYRGFQPPVLFALGESTDLLEEIAGEPELLLHVREGTLALLRRRYRVSEEPMWRMVLDRGRFPAAPANAVRLTSADLPALECLFADGDLTGQRPHFFLPSMVDDGVFCGVREIRKRGQAPLPERPEGCFAQRCLTPFSEGDLIAVAGTHLVSAAESVAAIGNIYTRRDCRGRGLAAQTTTAVVVSFCGKG